MADNNVVWHHATVTRKRREGQNAHKSVILWFTGLSNSGKSTIAHATEERLHTQGCRTFVFDGDNVRHGLCADLGSPGRTATRTSAGSARWPSCSSRPA